MVDGVEGGGAAPAALREVLSWWASTVTVVAVRDEGQVHAVTATSFFPVSLEPPLVAVSLGANARPLPWLDPGAGFAISLLAEGQRRIASAFADPLPQIPPPFPASGPPTVDGALAALVCTVQELHDTAGGARLVVARVDEARSGDAESPLLYWRRGYRGVSREGE